MAEVVLKLRFTDDPYWRIFAAALLRRSEWQFNLFWGDIKPSSEIQESLLKLLFFFPQFLRFPVVLW